MYLILSKIFPADGSKVPSKKVPSVIVGSKATHRRPAEKVFFGMFTYRYPSSFVYVALVSVSPTFVAVSFVDSRFSIPEL